jgi:hypothetical protein
MLVMVIERLKDGNTQRVGERFQQSWSNAAPDVTYHAASWMDSSGTRCVLSLRTRLCAELPNEKRTDSPGHKEQVLDESVLGIFTPRFDTVTARYRLQASCGSLRWHFQRREIGRVVTSPTIPGILFPGSALFPLVCLGTRAFMCSLLLLSIARVFTCPIAFSFLLCNRSFLRRDTGTVQILQPEQE